jgi:hypothetical protein
MKKISQSGPNHPHGPNHPLLRYLYISFSKKNHDKARIRKVCAYLVDTEVSMAKKSLLKR